MANSEKFDEYTKVSYAGRKLLEKHDLVEYGIWTVRGEDPNPDMGGSHFQPFLGVFEGHLDHVIEAAVKLDRFWSWGGGGTIEKIHVINVSSGRGD